MITIVPQTVQTEEKEEALHNDLITISSDDDLFMGGLFFGMAANQAGSEIAHLNRNDNRAIYTFILQSETGRGEFCVP